MNVLRNEPLTSHNSLALEASASALARIDDSPSVAAALDFAQAQQLPVVPLGAGSNIVLVGDINALVLLIETRGIDVIDESEDAVLLRVAAGEGWHDFVQWTVAQGYYGLENLALIPGTVGAAPIQNIGAYGVELAPFVHQVHCIEIATGKERIMEGASCKFTYRDSIFKRALRDQLIIVGIDLRLSRKPDVHTDYPVLAHVLDEQGISHATPQQVFDAVVGIRRSKLPDPSQIPNAGSFFKNPEVSDERATELARQFSGLPQYPQPGGRTRLPAAWFIEHCGWKGYQRDGLGVHPEHALVMVNYRNNYHKNQGKNQGKALLELAQEVAASVLEVFDIRLEMEPSVYGGAM